MGAGVVPEIVVYIGGTAGQAGKLAGIDESGDTVEVEAATIRLWNERHKVVTANVGARTDRRLVRVVTGAIPRETVGAFVSYIGDFNVHRWGQLTLNRGVPSVQSWQPLHGRADARSDVVVRPTQGQDAV